MIKDDFLRGNADKISDAFKEMEIRISSHDGLTNKYLLREVFGAIGGEDITIEEWQTLAKKLKELFRYLAKD